MSIKKSNQETKNEQKFLTSCMLDKMMVSEYKNTDKRYAICQKQWDKKRKKKGAKSSLEELKWEDQIVLNQDGDCIILI